MGDVSYLIDAVREITILLLKTKKHQRHHHYHHHHHLRSPDYNNKEPHHTVTPDLSLISPMFNESLRESK